MRQSPTAVFVAAALTGCALPIRTGALIDRYSSAECIPVGFGPGMKLRDGVSVHISGARMSGGRIDVRYTLDGKDDVAANAGDYIYPADVRFDRAGERLYVKASTGGVWRAADLAL